MKELEKDLNVKTKDFYLSVLTWKEAWKSEGKSEYKLYEIYIYTHIFLFTNVLTTLNIYFSKNSSDDEIKMYFPSSFFWENFF